MIREPKISEAQHSLFPKIPLIKAFYPKVPAKGLLSQNGTNTLKLLLGEFPSSLPRSRRPPKTVHVSEAIYPNHSCHGSMTRMPHTSKSDVLRVARAEPRERAMAEI